MSTNPQRPFAYLPKSAKKPVVPINIKWSIFPSNYVAMCTNCLLPYQKVNKLCRLCKTLDVKVNPKSAQLSDATAWVTCQKCNRRLPCTKCTSAHIKKFIPILLPWVLLPPKLPRIYGFNDYLEGSIAFSCRICGVRYGSLAVYSTLCDCAEHSAKNNRFTCRYCCLLVNEKLLKAINRAREREKMVPISATIQQIFRPYSFGDTTIATRTLHDFNTLGEIEED